MPLHQVCVQIHPHSFHSCFVAEVESPKFQYMHRVLVEVVGKENNLFFQAGKRASLLWHSLEFAMCLLRTIFGWYNWSKHQLPSEYW